MIPISDNLVPKEVKETLAIQQKSNGGKWLKTNSVKYFPNGRRNDRRNKMITYHQLKSGNYAITNTQYID